MNDGKLILFQGDSVTDANRMREDVQTWNKGHRLGDGYACMAAGRLSYKYPDKNLSFINKGLAGNRIRDLYARMQEHIINFSPDILSILIGVNEVWSRVNENCGTVEPKRFETVYRLMIEEIRDKLPNTKIIIIEPFVANVESLKDGYETWHGYIAPLQEVTARLAAEFECSYIPMQDVFDDLSKTAPASYWVWDGIHPTQAGHEAIAGQWVKCAEKLL